MDRSTVGRQPRLMFILIVFVIVINGEVLAVRGWLLVMLQDTYNPDKKQLADQFL